MIEEVRNLVWATFEKDVDQEIINKFLRSLYNILEEEFERGFSDGYDEGMQIEREHCRETRGYYGRD